MGATAGGQRREQPHKQSAAACGVCVGYFDSSRVGSVVQAAARFSLLAHSTCPQATGVVIDDFLQQYIGKNDTSGCVNASCPTTQPHKYGSASSGNYCCPHAPVNGGGDCGRPACHKQGDTDCACCLLPGSSGACQGALRCAGAPSTGKVPCHTKPQITLHDMMEIKAAVQGHTIRPDGAYFVLFPLQYFQQKCRGHPFLLHFQSKASGKNDHMTGTVDHSSPALTPHLTLGIVWYDFELVGNYEWVKKDGLLEVIDAVSPWVWHQSAAATTKANYTALIKTLYSYIPKVMPVFPGAFICS